MKRKSFQDADKPRKPLYPSATVRKQKPSDFAAQVELALTERPATLSTPPEILFATLPTSNTITSCTCSHCTKIAGIQTALEKYVLNLRNQFPCVNDSVKANNNSLEKMS